MRRYDVIAEICDYMLELGWGPYQNDHEDANGQFEMNWEFDDALRTADKHSFFKFMVKSVAEKHGYRATFMPKPIAGLTGNGCHVHISVWDKDGKTNVFADKDMELGSVRARSHLPRRDHEARQCAGGDHQPNRQLLQAHQRAAHHVRCNVGAEHGHVDGQQPHPYGPCARPGPFRAPPARWCGEPVLAAVDHHRGRPVGGENPSRSGQAPRHRHVRRRPHQSPTPRASRSTCSTPCASTRPIQS